VIYVNVLGFGNSTIIPIFAKFKKELEENR